MFIVKNKEKGLGIGRKNFETAAQGGRRNDG
jgi:hypothetical protein